MQTRQFFLIVLLCVFSIVTSIFADEAPALAWGIQFGTAQKDFPNEVAADNDGNVYVVGETSGVLGAENAGSADGFITKFDAAGNQQWSAQFGSNKSDAITGVDVLPSGDVIILGKTGDALPGQENFGRYDIFLARLDAAGNTVWLQQLGTDQTDTSTRMLVDNNGAIYITGKTNGNFGGELVGSSDVFVLKFANDGTQIWASQFGTPSADEGRDLALAADGSIYVVGTTSGGFDIANMGDQDAFVAKLDAAGKLVWARQHGSNEKDNGQSLTVSSHGEIFVGGWTGGVMQNRQFGGGDPYLTLYTADGTRLWTKQFGTANWDGIHGMAAFPDASGDVLIGGCWNWPNCQGWLQRYNVQGEMVWEKRISNNSAKSSCGQTVAIDKRGNCFHIGGTDDDLYHSNFGGQDAFVVKLGTATGVEESLLPQLPDFFLLCQNWPNPFNPKTEIKYTLLQDSQVQLDIFNLNGSLINTPVNTWQPVGTYNFQWDAKDMHSKDVSSGIYFYQLRTAQHAETKRMLLLR